MFVTETGTLDPLTCPDPGPRARCCAQFDAAKMRVLLSLKAKHIFTLTVSFWTFMNLHSFIFTNFCWIFDGIPRRLTWHSQPIATSKSGSIMCVGWWQCGEEAISVADPASLNLQLSIAKREHRQPVLNNLDSQDLIPSYCDILKGIESEVGEHFLVQNAGRSGRHGIPERSQLRQSAAIVNTFLRRISVYLVSEC